MALVLALDQGTTSSRAILYDAQARALAVGQVPVAQHYPAPGWVEQDPEALFASCLDAIRACLEGAGRRIDEVSAIGIANQRETALLWHRGSGRPLANAIVWQDRRTAPACERLRAEGLEGVVRARTGLLLDPYFSATKIAWLLDHVPGARALGRRGEIAAGTVDSWLAYRLTAGRRHVTDATNASRTALFDIRRQAYDPDLLAAFDVPGALLPAVTDTSGRLGETDPGVLGARIPICALAGDQQAALYGLGCTAPGAAKATYGTGAFLLMQTGGRAVEPEGGLLATVAWRLDGVTSYALEGSVFMAGAVVDFLRDRLGLVDTAAESEAVAESVPDTGDVYLVPAFAGLGAPDWDPRARGVIVGLTLSSDRRHVVRAGLEAIAYQCAELLSAMEARAGRRLERLRVDGGASRNGFLAQFQADIAGVVVERLADGEATARGAALLAGRAIDLWPDPDAAAAALAFDRTFRPGRDDAWRAAARGRWRAAVARARDWGRDGPATTATEAGAPGPRPPPRRSSRRSSNARSAPRGRCRGAPPRS